ncbi:MAG TPA: hypothetical protein VIL34_00680 [Actinopolymorphaceae bacterium]
MTGITRRKALGVVGAAVAGTLVAPSSPASGSTQPPLNWPPPSLTDPETIPVGASGHARDLNVNRDYIIELPSTIRTTGLIVEGGRNVVIVGGHIRLPVYTGDGLARAIYIIGNQGVVHIEGVLIEAVAEGLGDGIAIQAPDSIVQVQRCRIMDIQGRQSVFHGDVIQPWGGVRYLDRSGHRVEHVPRAVLRGQRRPHRAGHRQAHEHHRLTRTRTRRRLHVVDRYAADRHLLRLLRPTTAGAAAREVGVARHR